MECPDCATWLHNGMIQLDSILRVDVFYEQCVAVIIYVPASTTPTELLKVVKNIGKEVCRFYGAEIIGHSPAKQALRLKQ
jgi:hypothetical protein